MKIIFLGKTKLSAGELYINSGGLQWAVRENKVPVSKFSLPVFCPRTFASAAFLR